MQHGNPKSRFRVSEFPVPLRGSAEGPQNPDFMFPSVQIPRYSSANSRFRVSEFPRFQGPSVGPRREPNFQIPCFLVGRFQDTPPPQIPDSKIPSVQIPGYSRANSRFRVSKIPRSLGRSAEGPQFPNSLLFLAWADSRILLCSANSRFQDSECADSWILPGKFQIPSFRVSEAPSWVRAQGTPKFQIPSFQVSEAPSWVRSGGTHIPDSEFPSFRGPLLGPSPPPNSRFRVSKFPRPPIGFRAQGSPKFQIPSFRVSEAPSTDVLSQRDTHIPECNT